MAIPDRDFVEQIKEELRQLALEKGVGAAVKEARAQLEEAAGYDLTNPSMGFLTEAIEDLDDEEPPRRRRI
jgi:hypothetical protein